MPRRGPWRKNSSGQRARNLPLVACPREQRCWAEELSPECRKRKGEDFWGRVGTGEEAQRERKPRIGLPVWMDMFLEVSSHDIIFNYQ